MKTNIFFIFLAIALVIALDNGHKGNLNNLFGLFNTKDKETENGEGKKSKLFEIHKMNHHFDIVFKNYKFLGEKS
jgi:hypothetical protein